MKFVSLAVLAALTFGLSACGGGGHVAAGGASPSPTAFDPATATDQQKWDEYMRLVKEEGIPKKQWVANNATQATKPSYSKVCEQTAQDQAKILELFASFYTKDELRQMNRGTALFEQVYCPEQDGTSDAAWTKYEAAATAKPKPADFTIKVKIRSEQCFGSAGCNVTFQIDPSYSGPSDLSSGKYDVTYQVLGVDDGPMINTFSIKNGKASFSSEEFASTSSSSSTLTAKVIRVDKA